MIEEEINDHFNKIMEMKLKKFNEGIFLNKLNNFSKKKMNFYKIFYQNRTFHNKIYNKIKKIYLHSMKKTFYKKFNKNLMKLYKMINKF